MIQSGGTLRRGEKTVVEFDVTVEIPHGCRGTSEMDRALHRVRVDIGGRSRTGWGSAHFFEVCKDLHVGKSVESSHAEAREEAYADIGACRERATEDHH